MKNRILLEKVHQVLSKCTSSPVYHELQHNEHKDLSDSYSVVINNYNICSELKQKKKQATQSTNTVSIGGLQLQAHENVINMMVIAYKVKKPRKRFNLFTKEKYNYSVIISPELNNSTTIGGSISYSNNQDKEIKFEYDDLCEEVYYKLKDLLESMSNAKIKQIMSGLEVIVDHNISAKREIGIEKIMENE